MYRPNRNAEAKRNKPLVKGLGSFCTHNLKPHVDIHQVRKLEHLKNFGSSKDSPSHKEESYNLCHGTNIGIHNKIQSSGKQLNSRAAKYQVKWAEKPPS